jgi:hypothetical protein
VHNSRSVEFDQCMVLNVFRASRSTLHAAHITTTSRKYSNLSTFD